MWVYFVILACFHELSRPICKKKTSIHDLSHGYDYWLSLQAPKQEEISVKLQNKQYYLSVYKDRHLYRTRKKKKKKKKRTIARMMKRTPQTYAFEHNY